jgi:[ribosomal protein S5]-alanine N-acetyltransferase
MPELPTVRLQILDATALQALVSGNLRAASDAAGVALPIEFLNDTWLWTLRLGQIIGEPSEAHWLVRVIVPETGPGAGRAVGHAGYHGAPDERGMVEIGYRIIPAMRRNGYARAAVTELLAWARANGARIARASISPGNARSLAIAAAFGFVEVGEQIDEIDGRELVFERPI